MHARFGRRTGQLYRLALGCRPHRGLVLGTVAAAVAGVGSTALFPLVARVAVDDAVRGVSREVTGLVLHLAANAVVGAVASFGRRYLGGRLAHRDTRSPGAVTEIVAVPTRRGCPSGSGCQARFRFRAGSRVANGSIGGKVIEPRH